MFSVEHHRDRSQKTPGSRRTSRGTQKGSCSSASRGPTGPQQPNTKEAKMVPTCFPTQTKSTGFPTKSTTESAPKPKSKSANKIAPTPERKAIMQWTARMGAVTAESLGDRLDVSVNSARGRLLALQKRGMAVAQRPLASSRRCTPSREPACDAARMRARPMQGQCRRTQTTCRVRLGRGALWSAATPITRCSASASCAATSASAAFPSRAPGWRAPDGGPSLHRPDLVLWPAVPGRGRVAGRGRGRADGQGAGAAG